MKTLGVYEKTLLVYVNVLVDENANEDVDAIENENANDDELDVEDDDEDDGELADVSADIFLFYILIHYLINK